MVRSNDDYIAERDRRAAAAAKERERAEKLWPKLQAAGDAKARRDLVFDDPAFQTWAFCEKLCHESAEVAEDDPAAAGELAALALDLIPRISGEDTLLAGLQECVWKHVGNVCRARGDLRAAEDAFERAKEFFLDGMKGIMPSVIQRDRLAGLEAALLRDQGNFPEALRTMDHAVTLSGDRSAGRPGLLLEKGRLHRRLGQPAKALEALSWAERDLARFSDPRLLLRLEIERGAVLCDLGRHAEVRKPSAALHKAAKGLLIEQARLLCLEGRVAAGLGQAKEAEAAARKARADLPVRAVPDLALLYLEIAALHARKGRSAELKSVVESTLRLAESPGLSRESAATLKLWGRLAAQEKLTPERAAQFAGDFARTIAGR